MRMTFDHNDQAARSEWLNRVIRVFLTLTPHVFFCGKQYKRRMKRSQKEEQNASEYHYDDSIMALKNFVCKRLVSLFRLVRTPDLGHASLQWYPKREFCKFRQEDHKQTNQQQKKPEKQKRNHVLSRFRTRDPTQPSRCKLLRIGDEIPAIF